MNSTRATLAIARRNMSQNWIVGVALRMALGFAGAFVVTPNSNPSVAYGLAIVYAAASGSELRVRDLMYFAAPLYGRQLARAHALTALAAAFAAPAAYFATAAARGTPWSWTSIVVTFLACAVAALVGLSASLRAGNPAVVYSLAAVAAGLAVLSLFLLGVPLYGSLALALVLGFIALRAFGETLARYDPIE